MSHAVTSRHCSSQLSFQCLNVLQSDPCLLHCLNHLIPCPPSVLELEQPTMDGSDIVVGVVTVKHLDLSIGQAEHYQEGVTLISNILGHMFQQ